MKRINNPILVSIAFALMVLTTSCYSQKQSSKAKGKSNSTETKKNTTETKVSTESKSNAQPENKETSSEKSSDGSTGGTLKNHAPEIQKIIKNENGVIRGYDFGTSKQKIKETEDAQYIADGKDFMIYNVRLNDKEKAELIYYFDENDKVKGFGIAFLVNATTMAENIEATLVDDFQKYFNERYGSLKTNDKNDDVWTSKDGSYTVEMGDSSDEADNNVEIEIEIFKKK